MNAQPKHPRVKNKLSPGYVWDYEVNSLGYKAYMNDIQASIALAQLIN